MENAKSRPATRHLFSRRGFLTGLGASVVQASLIGQAIPRFASAQRLGGYPFTLGIASGDPLPDGIVLWTRLAPDPLNGGGMPSRSVAVEWQIALDSNMQQVVQRGAVLATPALGHSVHVEVNGLEASRWYWYQFKVGSDVSQIGRTRTAPPEGTSLDQLRFAFISCQNYVNGYYPALQRMAEEDLEFCVHLGDYIYESGGSGVRAHLPAREIFSIDDYRTRYAQYKSDPALQAVHANFPWLMTWDDHEVENDYAGFLPENAADTSGFADRRARAYQVYYEHMPLRQAQIPTGPYLQLYRNISFGSLAQFSIMDTRQYRSARAPASCPANTRINGYCPAALDPSRTIEGDTQREWLLNSLANSKANWNVMANQVPFAPADGNPDPAIQQYGNEKWDGYPVDRQKVLDFLSATGLKNTIVLTGDLHLSYVRDVPPDYVNLDATPVGTEFIGTSVSSGGDRAIATTFGGDVNNPHQHFYNNGHGYVLCTITPQLWTSDFRVVPSVLVEDAPVSTLASFVVEQGRAGAQRA